MRRATTVEQFGKPVSGSIPTIIRSFKSAGQNIWQHNYYEHIIRNQNEHQQGEHKGRPYAWVLNPYIAMAVTTKLESVVEPVRYNISEIYQ